MRTVLFEILHSLTYDKGIKREVVGEGVDVVVGSRVECVERSIWAPRRLTLVRTPRSHNRPGVGLFVFRCSLCA